MFPSCQDGGFDSGAGFPKQVRISRVGTTAGKSISVALEEVRMGKQIRYGVSPEPKLGNLIVFPEAGSRSPAHQPHRVLLHCMQRRFFSRGRTIVFHIPTLGTLLELMLTHERWPCYVYIYIYISGGSGICQSFLVSESADFRS